ncbi:conserved exported hypothetical protein [Rubrivivax sp. A210]|uniref:DUF4197 domain-containing protein n=1 Tax=Rubrivivax sp. A210 TaxID=2772301 RepID=UPI001918920C|nr:DUF4197 domain-containing protein [Rubrivivax sp. A210]CAD5373723.1 conserved exported hypothetical protein [Rubrivivax sp. A210]
MQRRSFNHALGATLAGSALWSPAWALSEGDAAQGIRQALQRGAEAALALLGRKDGFLGNPNVKIPLPDHLEDAAKLLRSLGQGRRIDELVTAMNRAAEAAVPEARSLLVAAVRGISVQDGLRLVRGGDSAVTDFFVDKTRAPLGEKFLPIISTATERVALAKKYNGVAGKAAGLGLVKPEDATIEKYVTRKSLDGLYYVIGEEERKIRRDPVATGSALLRRVFGG